MIIDASSMHGMIICKDKDKASGSFPDALDLGYAPRHHDALKNLKGLGLPHHTTSSIIPAPTTTGAYVQPGPSDDDTSDDSDEYAQSEQSKMSIETTSPINAYSSSVVTITRPAETKTVTSTREHTVTVSQTCSNSTSLSEPFIDSRSISQNSTDPSILDINSMQFPFMPPLNYIATAPPIASNGMLQEAGYGCHNPPFWPVPNIDCCPNFVPPPSVVTMTSFVTVSSVGTVTIPSIIQAPTITSIITQSNILTHTISVTVTRPVTVTTVSFVTWTSTATVSERTTLLVTPSQTLASQNSARSGNEGQATTTSTVVVSPLEPYDSQYEDEYQDQLLMNAGGQPYPSYYNYENDPLEIYDDSDDYYYPYGYEYKPQASKSIAAKSTPTSMPKTATSVSEVDARKPNSGMIPIDDNIATQPFPYPPLS